MPVQSADFFFPPEVIFQGAQFQGDSGHSSVASWKAVEGEGEKRREGTEGGGRKAFHLA